MTPTPELALAARREHGASSLANFAKLAWPILEPATPLKWGWALDAICEHLEAVEDGRIKRLLMNVPPGSMKSLLTSVLYPAWVWGPKGKPQHRFLATAHKQDLAIRDNLKCRRLIQSAWFQNAWPVKMTGDQNAKTKFENAATGFREAMAFTGMTGSRGDCFLAGTMVTTNLGQIAIEDIVNNSISCNVLSYDENSRSLVQRPIKAVARRSSPDFYRVHFANGGMVECTGDHRIYTTRGYREARLLSSHDVLLRSVWEGDYSQRIPDEEGAKERAGANDLRPSMQSDYDQPCGGEDGAALQYLRDKMPTRQEAMFAGLLERGGNAPRSVEKAILATHSVQGLQYRRAGENSQSYSAILFDSVQEYGSFAPHERREQSRMAQWDERTSVHECIAIAIPQDTSEDNRAGRRTMRGLRGTRRSLRASYRYRPREQRMGQSCDVMPVMPHDVARYGAFGVEAETVALVERVHQSAEVYDIQVEGTECFFANGVLVHNCVILDDPHSVDDANSAVRLAADILTFREALPSRVNNDESAIVIIMQRLNESDVSAVAKDLGYEHLMIPMRFEEDRKCSTIIGWSDPRTDEGELMFPDRFPEKQVVELERTLGAYATAGQLQQRPAPREGGMFKHGWFQPISALPNDIARTVRAWDQAATAKSTSNDPDWTVGTRMSVTKGGLYIVEGVRRFRGSPMDVEREITTTAARDGQGVTIRLPQDPGSAGKAYVAQMVNLLAGYAVKVERPQGDKATRAAAFAAQAEAGNVRILVTGDLLLDLWVQPFLDELGLFPAVKHDDQVDAASDAFNELALGGSSYQFDGWM